MPAEFVRAKQVLGRWGSEGGRRQGPGQIDINQQPANGGEKQDSAKIINPKVSRGLRRRYERTFAALDAATSYALP